MNDYRAKDIMTKNVKCVSPDMKINELNKIFVKDRINGAPVIDENKNLVGVVSKSDIIDYDLKKGMHASSMSDYYHSTGLEPQQMTDDFIKTETLSLVDTTVKDIMKANVITGQPNDSIHDLANTMHAKKIHRLVIVEGSKVIGIVSTLDILQVVGAMEKERNETKQKLDIAFKAIEDLRKKIGA